MRNVLHFQNGPMGPFCPDHAVAGDALVEMIGVIGQGSID